MKTLAISAYEKLRELLAFGEFPPGCHLVNLELSRRIGVGLTPVREAVTRLSSEGLVEHLPGAGAFVRRPSPIDVLQLSDLRAVLEPFAVEQAAELRTEDDLRGMQALLAEEFGIVRDAAATPERRISRELSRRWLLIERRFHGLILTAARNPWLAKAASDVSVLSIAFSPERFEPAWLDLTSMVASWRDHRRLARLVRLRRGADAADLMRRHLATGRKSVEQFLMGRVSPLQTGTLLPVGDGDENPQPLARRRGRPPKATVAKRPVAKQSRKKSADRTRP